MKRTINLSNTQFRYQLVFFIHIYGCIWLHIWLAEGCLWHLLPRQNLWWHLLPGGMFWLLQCGRPYSRRLCEFAVLCHANDKADPPKINIEWVLRWTPCAQEYIGVDKQRVSCLSLQWRI